MAKGKGKSVKRTRRTFTREFKQQAVQMILNGYSDQSWDAREPAGRLVCINQV